METFTEIMKAVEKSLSEKQTEGYMFCQHFIGHKNSNLTNNF